MFHFSGEEIAGIAVAAGFVVLYFRTVKDLKRERLEGIELKKEVSELSARLKALREQEESASARCLDVPPGSRAANGGLRYTRVW